MVICFWNYVLLLCLFFCLIGLIEIGISVLLWSCCWIWCVEFFLSMFFCCFFVVLSVVNWYVGMFMFFNCLFSYLVLLYVGIKIIYILSYKLCYYFNIIYLLYNDNFIRIFWVFYVRKYIFYNIKLLYLCGCFCLFIWLFWL